MYHVRGNQACYLEANINACTENNILSSKTNFALDVWGSEEHLASASGEDHASTGVPPQLLENNPKGTLY